MKNRLFIMMAVVFAASLLLGATVSTISAKDPVLYPATTKCVNQDVWECYIWKTSPLISTECCVNTYEPCNGEWVWYVYWNGSTMYLCTEPNGGGTCTLQDCP